MTDHHHGVLAETSQTAHYALIVGKCAVSVQLMEVFKDGVNVVERVRAVGVAGDLSRLPRREIGVDLRRARAHLALEFGERFVFAHTRFKLLVFEFFDFFVDFTEILFEIQKYCFGHAFVPNGKTFVSP